MSNDSNWDYCRTLADYAGYALAKDGRFYNIYRKDDLSFVGHFSRLAHLKARLQQLVAEYEKECGYRG